MISTGDKDLAQLVSERVTLVNTMSNERLDPEGVQAKFGVPPERILDYMTLVGDSVDNVPGVEKVGPKTAAKWVSQYGSLEEVMSHASEIGGAVGENLRKALDWLPKGRQLLAVKCDVKLPVDLEELKLAPRDDKQLGDLLSRFGFKSWLKEAPPGRGAAPTPRARRPRAPRSSAATKRCSTEADLSRWLAELEAAGPRFPRHRDDERRADAGAARGLVLRDAGGPRGVPAARSPLRRRAEPGRDRERRSRR